MKLGEMCLGQFMPYRGAMKAERSIKRVGYVSLSALALSLTSNAAFAQDNIDSASSEGEAIVVTASRVARDGFSAPTPTTVIGAAQLEARGATNVSTVLYEIPAFRPTAPSSQGFAGSPPGVDLRGLGGDRTLTLMDGRRLVPSAGVDLNLIPSLIMERVEVVTGGASAQWGSDAVAGVVNFITKQKFTGLQANLQGGISRYGDYKEYNAGLLVGKPFAGGRGHVTLSGEFTRNDGTDTFYSRPWGQQEYILFNNPAPATNGLPLRWIASHAHLSTMTQGGIITSGPLRGTQFGPGGTPIPFQYGEYAGAVNMIGGDNHGNTFAKTLKFAPPTTRYSFYGRGDYEISDSTSVYAEAMYGYSFVESAAIVAKDQGSVTLSPNASRANPLVIRIDNAFLPAATRAEMERLGLTYINMGRFSDDLGAMNPDIKNRMLRVAVGAKGELGGGWEWDGYYQYGQNKLSNIIDNNRVDANWLRAVDAVFVPATGAPASLTPGSIVCRSTLTNPTNGCAPANIFGPNSVSAAAHAYTYQQSWAFTTFAQHTAGLNLRGDLFDTWAGPVSFGAGVEYRHEDQSTRADPISQSGGFNLGNPKSLSGNFDVKEAYAEVVVPLARDQSWARSLDLQGAIRAADYSSIGSVVTWKVGATWELNDDIRIRASQSRDIRAPNIVELYSSPVQGTISINDPRLAAPNNNYLVNQLTVGNDRLQEEKGDTFTGGIVFSPSAIPGFTISADYWNINLKGAISTLAINTVIARCESGLSEYCPFVTRDSATGRISEVTLTQINLSSLKTSGIDVEASYRLPLSSVASGLGGTVTLRALGTYLIDKVVDDTLTVVDRAGEIGRNSVNNGPRFRASAMLGYSDNAFSGSIQAVHVSGGPYDVTYGPRDMLDNHVAGRTYFNLMAQHKLGRGIELFGVVNNLFNTAPPANPNTGGGSSPFTGGLHDLIGQRFTVGVRFK